MMTKNSYLGTAQVPKLFRIIVLQNVLSLFRIDFNHEYLLKIRNKDFRLKQLNDI